MGARDEQRQRSARLRLIVWILGEGAPESVRYGETLAVLPPGTRAKPFPSAVALYPREVERPDGTTEQIMEEPSDLSVTLAFRDTAGRIWLRDTDGRLQQTGTLVDGEVMVYRQDG